MWLKTYQIRVKEAAKRGELVLFILVLLSLLLLIHFYNDETQKKMSQQLLTFLAEGSKCLVFSHGK